MTQGKVREGTLRWCRVSSYTALPCAEDGGDEGWLRDIPVENTPGAVKVYE